MTTSFQKSLMSLMAMNSNVHSNSCYELPKESYCQVIVMAIHAHVFFGEKRGIYIQLLLLLSCLKDDKYRQLNTWFG